MTLVREQLIEHIRIMPDNDEDLKFWEDFLDPSLKELVEKQSATIIYTHTQISTTASCKGSVDGTMNYVIGVVDKEGHPYCLECGERDDRTYSPAQLIEMFPDQAHFLIPFFHDHSGIVNLRQSLDD